MTPIRPALALATALLAPAALFAAAPRAGAQTLSEAMAQSYASNPSPACRAGQPALGRRERAAGAGRLAADRAASASPAARSIRGCAALTAANGFDPETGFGTRPVRHHHAYRAAAVHQPAHRHPAGLPRRPHRRHHPPGREPGARPARPPARAGAAGDVGHGERLRQRHPVPGDCVRLRVNNEQVLTEQLRATNERFRVGEITRTDVAQAESRLANARAAPVPGRRPAADQPGDLSACRRHRRRHGWWRRSRCGRRSRNAQEAALAAATNNPTVVAALFDEAAARDAIDVQMSQPAAAGLGAGPGLPVGQPDRPAYPHHRRARSLAQLTVPLYQGGAEYSQVRQARQSAQQARQTGRRPAPQRRAVRDPGLGAAAELEGAGRCAACGDPRLGDRARRRAARGHRRQPHHPRSAEPGAGAAGATGPTWCRRWRPWSRNPTPWPARSAG